MYHMFSVIGTNAGSWDGAGRRCLELVDVGGRIVAHLGHAALAHVGTEHPAPANACR